MRAVSAWRTALTIAAIITILNIAVYGLGRLLGADLVVRPPSGGEMTVSVLNVLLTSLLPTVPGALALWWAARRSLRAWHGVGWLGLVIGLVTVAAPATTPATTPTALTLACMHIIAGAAWLVVVRRHAAHLRRDSTGTLAPARTAAQP